MPGPVGLSAVNRRPLTRPEASLAECSLRPRALPASGRSRAHGLCSWPRGRVAEGSFPQVLVISHGIGVIRAVRLDSRCPLDLCRQRMDAMVTALPGKGSLPQGLTFSGRHEGCCWRGERCSISSTRSGGHGWIQARHRLPVFAAGSFRKLDGMSLADSKISPMTPTCWAMAVDALRWDSVAWSRTGCGLLFLPGPAST